MWKYLYNEQVWGVLEWKLRHYSQLFWVLPLLVALVFGRWKTRTQRAIILFSFTVAFLEHYSTDTDWQMLFNHVGTSPLYHIYSPIFVLMLFYLFSKALFIGKHLLKWWVVPVLFVVFAVANALWLDGFYNFPSNTAVAYSVFGISLSIGYFVKTINALEVAYLEREPMFWVSSGMLLYFSGSFLFWVCLNFLTYDVDFFFSIYAVNGWLAILLSTCLCIALAVGQPSRNVLRAPIH